MLQRKISTLRRKFPSSIPILKLRNKQLSLSNRNILTKHLRYVSSGIPLASIALLLFLFGISIVCPSLDIPFFSSLFSDAYAEDVNNSNEGGDLDDENYEIDLLANAPNAEATLTIGGEAINATTNVGLGSVGYRKHTVKIKTTDVTNYTLSITGPTNLTGNTTVTGAGNKTPANMANNTWGYYYGDSSNESSVAYQSFTGSAQSLETNNTGVNNPGTTAKNLIFAAKFADTATAGHYTASVVLSLVATPKQINTYTLSYNTNGGSTAPSSTQCTTAVGGTSCSVTVTSTTPTKTNNEFLGWSTSSTATEADANYAAGKTVSISADTQLYAVWGTSEQTYTITYVGNNQYVDSNSVPPKQTCITTTNSCTLSAQGPTNWCGRTFNGWSTVKVEYNANVSPLYQPGETITVTGDTTLYGVWSGSDQSDCA